VLAGLSAETTYDIYVREQCLGGGFSTNSCPLTIHTRCSPRPPTLLTDFNAVPICHAICAGDCNLSGPWFNSQSDEMDWISWSGPTPTSLTGPDDDVEGGGHYLYL
ncbi:MAG: hypothetical protein KDC44_19585, partial [Phaeodactylibacter sp.]|nr:hypothetical protein [Phaeodactylibacter sp.]